MKAYLSRIEQFYAVVVTEEQENIFIHLDHLFHAKIGDWVEITSRERHCSQVNEGDVMTQYYVVKVLKGE